MRLIEIFGSLFLFGMVPQNGAAANMSFTEMDISQGANVVFKRKFFRQFQFEKDLESDDVYKLLQSMSLTNMYHRYFK